MKLCNNDLKALADLIRKKGMGKLITDDAEQAAHKARLWLQGASRPEDFDPLVVSVLELYKKAGEVGIMLRPEQCPMCYLRVMGSKAAGMTADRHWMDNVTDAVLIAARVNGLVRG